MRYLIHNNLKYLTLNKSNSVLENYSPVMPAGQFCMGLLKGSTTKKKEIKKTIAFFLEIVPTEKDDLTLREYILLPLRDKILKE